MAEGERGFATGEGNHSPLEGQARLKNEGLSARQGCKPAVAPVGGQSQLKKEELLESSPHRISFRTNRSASATPPQGGNGFLTPRVDVIYPQGGSIVRRRPKGKGFRRGVELPEEEKIYRVRPRGSPVEKARYLILTQKADAAPPLRIPAQSAKR